MPKKIKLYTVEAEANGSTHQPKCFTKKIKAFNHAEKMAGSENATFLVRKFKVPATAKGMTKLFNTNPPTAGEILEYFSPSDKLRSVA